MKEIKYTVKYTTGFKKDYKAWLENSAIGAGRSIAGNRRIFAR